MLAQKHEDIGPPAGGLGLPLANILLVDDKVENLIALEAILQPLQQRLIRAQSGADALRHLLGEDIACILMDVQMPDMDGFETIDLIKARERTSHIPVIFITAISKEIKYVFRGYSTGAVDYISKPFNPDILRSKVAVFVDLYYKEQKIKLQAELLAESIRREAERKQIEIENELEQKHLKEMAQKLEASVLQRTRELRETNRDLEAFCYSIAHDLRTPIREIVATSNFLLEDAGPKLAREEVDNLKSQCAAAQKMGRLIDDLLRLSRLGRKAIKRTTVDLSHMVRATCKKKFSEYTDRKFTLHVRPGVSVQADAGLVEILLQNLIENAAKYSPAGGKIMFGLIENTDGQTFFLSDEGIGFDMRYERKLFLPFERLNPDTVYEGTGIGLALVQKIVVKHGGRVWAEGKPEIGSTFYFTLGPRPAPGIATIDSFPEEESPHSNGEIHVDAPIQNRAS